jgi:hypothetical protein
MIEPSTAEGYQQTKGKLADLEHQLLDLEKPAGSSTKRNAATR